MKKQLTFLFFILLSISLYAQNSESIIVDGKPVSEEEFYNIQNNGWSIIEFQGLTLLGNFSNKDYLLRLNINCSDTSKKSSFLIEYSDNYRDGTFGGLDFVSSKPDEYRIITFSVDNQEFDNPFIRNDKNVLLAFKEALKSGKMLTIKTFIKESNPYVKEEVIKLGREIEFKLDNSHLLDTPISCK